MYKSLSDIRKEFKNYFVKNDHKIVKSSSLIPHNDNTLLFTNAGMVQFKDVFLGLENTPYKRAVSVQKCLRAGGKHNDLDNVGFTARHHTFFEMLGNFSFGDYFKEKAIFYAYEFITKILNLNKDKLVVTTYHNDDETYNLWQKITGFSKDKIIKINSSDNFWSMGDTGPCGPCTEIFYDLGDSVFGGLPGTEYAYGDRYTEIWNLVFMQYNQVTVNKIIPLHNPAVDTGMGLERLASIIQGKLDNYDIDLFQNIIKATEELLKIKLTPDNKVSFKVIADHIRASIFLITDGVIPSNEGRGYVLRRIIRRAIRHGYLLGNTQPIFYKLVPLINNLMQDIYPELELSCNLTTQTIFSEEEKFNKTIKDGMHLLNKSKILVKNNLLPGKVAFKLYDTYGFPLDLTESILQQDNIKINIEQFNQCMNNQKELSKKSWIGSGEIKDNNFWFSLKENLKTQFIGYDCLNYPSTHFTIVDLDLNLKDSLKEGEEAYILFDKTPFYPEGGGQVGDKGIIVGTHTDLNMSQNIINSICSICDKHILNITESINELDSILHVEDIYEPKKTTLEDITFLAEVLDTKKIANELIIHKIKVIKGNLKNGIKCLLLVNKNLRKCAAANHTATHILFAALKKVLGYEVAQQGSLVTPDRLRVDVYLNSNLTQDQIRYVELEANKIILSNLKVNVNFLPYQEAINKGVKFLMGENYPDIVRVVTIGDNLHRIVSQELCGGCHVKYTGEIGIFKIISESSIKSGVRRIEVKTGKSALEEFQNIEQLLITIYHKFKGNKDNILNKINSVIDENKILTSKVNALEKQSLLMQVQKNIQLINNTSFINIVLNPEEFSKSRELISLLIDKYKHSLVILFTNKASEKLSFIFSISKDLVKKINLTDVMNYLKTTFNSKGGGNNFIIQGSLPLENSNKFEQYIKNLIKNFSRSP